MILLFTIIAAIASLVLCVCHLTLICWLSHNTFSSPLFVEKIDRGFLEAGVLISALGMLIPIIPPLQCIPAASIVVGAAALCLAVPCRPFIAYFLYRWCGPMLVISGIALIAAGHLAFDGQRLLGSSLLVASFLAFGFGLHLTNKVIYQNRAW